MIKDAPFSLDGAGRGRNDMHEERLSESMEKIPTSSDVSEDIATMPLYTM